MSIRLLDEKEFHATFVDPMRRLGEEEASAALDIGPYVSECLELLREPVSMDDIEIHHVYLSGDARYTHVMLYDGTPNQYLVIVTDNTQGSIVGHHWLDLNAKYGLTDSTFF